MRTERASLVREGQEWHGLIAVLSSMTCLLSCPSPVKKREAEDHHEKRPRDGGGIAHLELLEGLGVDVIAERGRCFGRSALSHDTCLLETALQAANYTHDNDKECG